MLIIAMFSLGLYGCGYRADPFYTQEAPTGDDNVIFIEKESNKK